MDVFVPKDLADLERLVAEQVEESVTREFKQALPQPGKNDDMAVAISAFANTEGGIIIYGIQEENSRAAGLTPVPLKGARERITQVAASSIDEPIHLTQIYEVPAAQDRARGFLIVRVPRSERAPHFVRGTAWGRTGTVNTPLSRRRVGELFAKSQGFAVEFGLTQARPGRVRARAVVEGAGIQREYFLKFDNDGDEPVSDAMWEWRPATDGEVPWTDSDAFELGSLEPGAEIRVKIGLTHGTASSLRVRTRWYRATQVEEQTGEWPVRWP